MLRPVEPQFSLCANTLKRDRRSVRDGGIERLGRANHAANGMLNHALTPSGSDRSFQLRSGQALSASLRAGMALDAFGPSLTLTLRAAEPSCGYPADLSGIQAGMTAFFP